MSAAVVYVHGLWMGGVEARPLVRRLSRERGFRVHVFRYRSLGERPDEICARLSGEVAALGAGEVHLVGHSLGGALILRFLNGDSMRQPGRVVFLGSPLLGSHTAGCLGRIRFGRFELGRRLLGATACDSLLQPAEQHWSASRELGIIAGTSPIGFAPLCGVREPNDGTVAVSETRLPGARAYLTLPVTHMGLLWSAIAARETGSFLAHGCFGR